MGFAYHPKMAVQELTEVQKRKRREFCHWIVTNNEIDFDEIVVTESRFCAGSDNSWWYVPRCEWNESVMALRKKFPKSVMCFGARLEITACRVPRHSRQQCLRREPAGVGPG